MNKFRLFDRRFKRTSRWRNQTEIEELRALEEADTVASCKVLFLEYLREEYNFAEHKEIFRTYVHDVNPVVRDKVTPS